MSTLRETIKQLTAQHLDAGHLVMGQCLTAVGWVGGTLPERHDMTEFPMSDVAQSGFVVGAALMGRRPIYVVRYQGFQWFNAALVVNYAAKSKELWGRPCPMMIRSIAMEGGIGPTTGSSHHSIVYRMPGMRVVAPMTPGEWNTTYEEFMSGDDVVYVSEHRGAYDTDREDPNAWPKNPKVVLFPISITRIAAFKAAAMLKAEGIPVAVSPLWRLKPAQVNSLALWDLSICGRGLVLDDDYTDGIAKSIAWDLMQVTDAQVDVMGLGPRSAGFADWNDNLPPSAEAIVAYVHKYLRR